MKSSICCGLVCLGALAHQPRAVLAQTAANWTPIAVEGLAEWSDPGPWWSAQDGVIVAESAGGDTLPKWHYLIWDGSLERDFELRLEYRILTEKPQDAGVCFCVDRAVPIKEQGNLACYQAELDTANLYSKERWIRDGKLFGNIHDGKRGRMFKRGNRVTIDAAGAETTVALSPPFRPAKVFRGPPSWNDCLIRVDGNRIQLFLNGQPANELVDGDVEQRSTGDAIALQFRPNDSYRFEVRNLGYRAINP